MGRFCWRCGTPETGQTPLVLGLCLDCFVEKHGLIRAPRGLRFSICRKCGAHRLGDRWLEPRGDETLHDKIRREVLSNLRVARLTDLGPEWVKPEDAEGLDLRIEPRFEGKKAWVSIEARGRLHGGQVRAVEEGLSLEVSIDSITCDACALKSAGHYEGILQVRGISGHPRGAEVEGLLRRCEGEMREKDPTAFIARIERRAGGLDLYVNPLALARRMARLLKGELGAELSESAKLVGQERGGRRRYRVSILARLG